ALRLLAEGVELSAPGHWLTEVATVLWAKSVIHGVLNRAQAEARLAWLAEQEVSETNVRSLLTSASSISFDLHLTVYDGLYLSLATKLAAPMVTADRELHDKARGDHRFAPLVVWVEDFGQPPPQAAPTPPPR
ncbi:MAG TPA: type II toxin-antitoxin system VapC family toxin, partial [Rhodopila sp.]|nr:type II toxin-antitoxin system VapC family toxin [Rhodopila sp.]